METPTLAQKILLTLLYGSVVLIVVFSFLAAREKDYEGFQKCVDKKCQRGGEAFCSKFREINNCCLGAGGDIAITPDHQYTCVFS